jgi:serine/threonine protein kinase
LARYIGHYEVVKQIGEGRFGTVFLAVGTVPGRGSQPGRTRLVSIKKLKHENRAGEVAQLLQEFELLEQVKHRSVVRVFEYLADEHAVVMEYIHGVSLRQMFSELDKAHEQIFTEAAIEVACEIADALFQAHTSPGDNGEALGLVHRDLKPANIMLTTTGEVKVLDWGLARVANADFSTEDPGVLRGSLLYMAPEQAQSLGVDHRTDLFALGLVLFELMTGETPYSSLLGGDDAMSVVKAAVEGGQAAELAAQVESRLPGVGPVITRMLQARPEDRHPDGHAVLVDLRRQLYRDRGAYRKEFSEFFFGSICDVGPEPTLESVKAKGRSRTPSAAQERSSIQDRLRQSMAREDEARAHSSTATGESMSSSDKPKRPRPPVGGGATRAPDAPRKGKVVGRCSTLTSCAPTSPSTPRVAASSSNRQGVRETSPKTNSGL